MKTRILILEDFAETVFYSEGMGDTAKPYDHDMHFHHMYHKRPGLAMIAAKIHDLAISNTPIMEENIGVLIFNTPEVIGFQLMFTDEGGADVMQACVDFAQGLADTAEDHPNITRESGNEWFFGAADEQALLDLIVDFADDQEFKFDGSLIADEFGGDYEAFHDEVEDPHFATWQESAEDALGCAWVMAALPEKFYITHDALLREAYRVRYMGIYTQQQIQDAIDASKKTPDNGLGLHGPLNTLSVIYH